ncbi:MAG TPA: tetratricopeptide repeat protein [Pirellulales bacterium]|nr:tetratricopeptide repeat protein [Pirellulales bacterium]
MKRSLTGFVVLMLLFCVTVAAVSAQRRGPRRGSKNPTPTKPTTSEGEETDEPEGGISSDPRLAKIQKEFVIETARLALDYEKKQDTDRARSCYEQILRIFPKHPGAEEALKKIRATELNAEHKQVRVNANEEPKDTGIEVIANRPITIHAEGSWTFRMEHELGPEGMKIPDELRDFNLGSLVGFIHSGQDPKDLKPFFVGKDAEIVPDQSGRLYLFMWDTDWKDNAGRLNVEIRGTFKKTK